MFYSDKDLFDQTIVPMCFELISKVSWTYPNNIYYGEIKAINIVKMMSSITFNGTMDDSIDTVQLFLLYLEHLPERIFLLYRLFSNLYNKK
jgi:hypothetical protein